MWIDVCERAHDWRHRIHPQSEATVLKKNWPTSCLWNSINCYGPYLNFVPTKIIIIDIFVLYEYLLVIKWILSDLIWQWWYFKVSMLFYGITFGVVWFVHVKCSRSREWPCVHRPHSCRAESIHNDIITTPRPDVRPLQRSSGRTLGLSPCCDQLL